MCTGLNFSGSSHICCIQHTIACHIVRHLSIKLLVMFWCYTGIYHVPWNCYFMYRVLYHSNDFRMEIFQATPVLVMCDCLSGRCKVFCIGLTAFLFQQCYIPASVFQDFVPILEPVMPLWYLYWCLVCSSLTVQRRIAFLSPVIFSFCAKMI